MSHRVTIQSSGHSFTVEDGETVLAAALREGRVIAYSCRSGTCGTCKGRLVEGRVDYGHYEERAMTEAEKQAGLALFCQAKPLTDLVIGVREIGAAVKGIQIKLLPARVVKMERPAPDIPVMSTRFIAGWYGCRTMLVNAASPPGCWTAMPPVSNQCGQSGSGTVKPRSPSQLLRAATSWTGLRTARPHLPSG